MAKKGAQIAITREALESILDVPEGMSIKMVEYDPMRDMVHVFFMGGNITVPEGQEMPYIMPFTVDSTIANEDITW